MKFRLGILIFIALTFAGCTSSLGPEYKSVHTPTSKHSGSQKPYKIKGVQYKPLASAKGFVQTGIASWYGRKFHGRKTANGEIYNMYAMTAAHKTLPLGTWVRVQNLKNKKKIVVRINDRGPFIQGRIIDLSYTGAKRLDIVDSGTAKVRITALGRAASYSKKTKKPVSFKSTDYWKGKFTVQVASFEVKANARKYQQKLSKTYKNVHISAFTDHRGTFYRVRIGRFTNLKTAERFSKRLLAKGFKRAAVIAE